MSVPCCVLLLKLVPTSPSIIHYDDCIIKEDEAVGWHHTECPFIFGQDSTHKDDTSESASKPRTPKQLQCSRPVSFKAPHCSGRAISKALHCSGQGISKALHFSGWPIFKLLYCSGWPISKLLQCSSLEILLVLHF